MKLTVTNLSCARGETAIISGVSFTVESGHSLVLRGSNGSGKTTLLRTLAGLCPPPYGTISIPPDNIAYAGHQDGIKAPLTVYENLRFWARIFGTKDITPAVETFDLMEFLDRPAQQLSAGQKRRLGLARLLVTARPVWLLDEPTVSLDVDNVETFSRVLQDHTAKGGIAVVATHRDLALGNAATLDLTGYQATPNDLKDPFLDEALA